MSERLPDLIKWLHEKGTSSGNSLCSPTSQIVYIITSFSSGCSVSSRPVHWTDPDLALASKLQSDAPAARGELGSRLCCGPRTYCWAAGGKEGTGEPEPGLSGEDCSFDPCHSTMRGFHNDEPREGAELRDETHKTQSFVPPLTAKVTRSAADE
ncbi:hypothetical protein EYF80_010079 [Liparis tanakae]|uniref:Uncharacterized protein n=1 Tax=Liparis tanakae TaxID=230148 RepID=A0A4Z2IP81_9TELE|nr:hypothetical protein EYF80_010079 [Liparis tanakae]